MLPPLILIHRTIWLIYCAQYRLAVNLIGPTWSIYFAPEFGPYHNGVVLCVMAANRPAPCRSISDYFKKQSREGINVVQFYESAYCKMYMLFILFQSIHIINILCLEAIVDSSAQAELNVIDGTWEWNIMTFLIYE